MFLGAIAGLAGAQVLGSFAGAQTALGVAVGGVLLLAARRMLRPPALDTTGTGRRARIAALLMPVFRAAHGAEKHGGAFGLGAATGFLPCGVTYLAAAQAAALGSPADGAVLMAAFGLGTMPVLAATALLGRGAIARLGTARVRTAGGLIMATAGCVAVVRALLPLTGLARVDLWGGRLWLLFERVDLITALKGTVAAIGILWGTTFATNIVVGRFFCGWGCPVGYVSRLGEELPGLGGADAPTRYGDAECIRCGDCVVGCEFVFAVRKDEVAPLRFGFTKERSAPPGKPATESANPRGGLLGARGRFGGGASAVPPGVAPLEQATRGQVGARHRDRRRRPHG